MTGLSGMPLGRFVAYTAVGSGIWNLILIGLGWVLGENWEMVSEHVQYLQYAVLFLLAAGVTWFLWSRWRARRQAQGTG